LPTANLPKAPGLGTKWSGDEKQPEHEPTESISSAIYQAPKISLAPTTPKPDAGLSPPAAPGERVNATFVTLARNSDLWEISRSIRQVEDRFNRQYNYDWVFLNDKPFDETFKNVTTSLVSGKTHYGQIPEEHWSFPPFIDTDKAKKAREDMGQRKVIYGDSVSYRHMCRFESGFFFRHELMNKFEYYWRVEPSIELFCDISYDPFKLMKDHGKKYSFVLSLYEYVETIPTLWNSVLSFMKEHPEHIVEDNSMDFLSDDDGKTYNHCHFVCPPVSLI
jgi:alpha 1,2-mannosyltransferase